MSVYGQVELVSYPAHFQFLDLRGVSEVYIFGDISFRKCLL